MDYANPHMGVYSYTLKKLELQPGSGSLGIPSVKPIQEGQGT